MNKVINYAAIASAAAASLHAQPEVSLTVYNNNLALVREVRPIELKKGLQEFRFENVAAEIDPTSVHFRCLANTKQVALLEQNFEYDLVGLSRLLTKYIGLEVVVTVRQGGTVTGKLLSAVGDDVVLETESGQIHAVKGGAVESVVFPSLPGGLVSKPTLVWLLNSAVSGPNKGEISYLTEGISWHAEYVAVVDSKDKSLDLAGWVSIENNSGATYTDARIKLIAGDVNRAEDVSYRPTGLRKEVMAMAMAADQFVEKEFFEYHLYTLQRPATIKDRQIKQMSLFEPQTTPVQKVFIYDPVRNEEKIQVRLEFKNSKENNLGMPLPAGKVRVYKRDEDGSQEFIGEDNLDHTPKDEAVRLTMGNAFDIVGKYTRLQEERIGDRSRRLTREVVLRNHKKEPIEVKVIDRFWGDWKLIGKTPTVIQKTADRVEFLVPVAADGEARFTYTVLVQ